MKRLAVACMLLAPTGAYAQDPKSRLDLDDPRVLVRLFTRYHTVEICTRRGIVFNQQDLTALRSRITEDLRWRLSISRDTKDAAWKEAAKDAEEINGKNPFDFYDECVSQRKRLSEIYPDVFVPPNPF